MLLQYSAQKMYDYLNGKLKDYLDKLAARLPCPGGGSVAALTAAVATALVRMVANYTTGRKTYAGVEREIGEILKKAEELQIRFQQMVEEDSLIYEKIQQASREKSSSLQQYLKESALLHLEIANHCPLLLEWNLFLLEKGNRNLISDVGIAAVLAAAAFRAARINAGINFFYLEDKNFVENGKRRLEAIEKTLLPLSCQIEQSVYKILNRQESPKPNGG